MEYCLKTHCKLFFQHTETSPHLELSFVSLYITLSPKNPGKIYVTKCFFYKSWICALSSEDGLYIVNSQPQKICKTFQNLASHFFQPHNHILCHLNLFWMYHYSIYVQIMENHFLAIFGPLTHHNLII